jgi:hypothetical protein
MANIVIDIASEFTGAKAFKQADSATQKLSNNVKSLAKTFGLAFGTASVIAYGKASIKAAAADQKAQKQLALALKNVGLGREAASSEDYIQRLQREFGILDDDLRPAYQTLAIATRDTNEAQRLLNLALDVSASTTKPLASVTAALSKAYLGNNTALSKLGIGISKADLKAKSFYDITEQLSSTFAGAAKAAANTYQGSIDRLSVAANDAKEVIGTGLIQAISAVGSTNGVDGLTTNMQKLSFYVSDTVEGIGIMVAYLKGIPGLGKVFDFLLTPSLPTQLGTQARAKRSEKFPQGAPASLTALGQNTSSKVAKDQVKTTKALTKATQENLKLTKAKAIFDLQKIQIEAALKGKISEEDRIRLLLMKAIEDENISQIEKYTKMLDEAQKNTEKLVSTLAGIKPLDDVFKNWNFMGVKEQLASLQSYFNGFAGSAASAFNALNQQQQAALGGYKPFVGASIPSVAATNPSAPSTVGLGTSGTGNQVPAGVTINVNTGVGDPNAIAEAIENVLVEANYRGTLRGLIAV